MGKVDLSKAKFGDVFRTHDGKKAILIHCVTHIGEHEKFYEFISAHDLQTMTQYWTDVNGKAKVSNDWKEREHDCDIVELWQ